MTRHPATRWAITSFHTDPVRLVHTATQYLSRLATPNPRPGWKNAVAPYPSLSAGLRGGGVMCRFKFQPEGEGPWAASCFLLRACTCCRELPSEKSA